MTFQSPLTLKNESMNLESLRNELDTFSEYQKNEFLAHHPVTDLVLGRSEYMDMLLTRLWEHYAFDKVPEMSLVAVGGYGRGELHPLSDIDILVLSQSALDDSVKTKVSEFITLLWDLRMEVGHSVRTVEECKEVGKDDLTVATNLQEARLICGCEDSFHKLKLLIHSESFW